MGEAVREYTDLIDQSVSIFLSRMVMQIKACEKNTKNIHKRGRATAGSNSATVMACRL